MENKKAKDIIREAYEERFSSQSYDKSNLKHTYEVVVINAMQKYRQDQAKSMYKVVQFIHNYPYDWVEQVFHGNQHLIDHIKSKWTGYAKRDDSRIAILKIMTELDSENERKLMEWIAREKFGKGGIIGKVFRKKVSPKDLLSF